MKTIKNAIIKEAKIISSNGLLKMVIELDYVGISDEQKFGGFILYSTEDIKKNCGNFIYEIMAIADVTDWSQIKGKVIRVKYASGNGGNIESIGHIIKDIWFSQTDYSELED